MGAGGAAAGLEALSPPGGLAQWRAGSLGPRDPGSRHILSPRCVPDLPRGSWDCILLGAGRGCSGGEEAAGPRGRGPALVPMSGGSPDCGPEPWGAASPQPPRGPQRGQGLSDGGAPYRSPPVYETRLSPHSPSQTSKTRVLLLPEHYKLLAPESGQWRLIVISSQLLLWKCKDTAS